VRTIPPSGGRLLAISDLHVRYPENREIVEDLRPSRDEDWLLIAGDVSERIAEIEWTLGTLRERYATVIWTPGNHDLWTPRDDALPLRGVARYEYLVKLCRSLDVLTPEDPYPIWRGEGGPATVVPLFLLYDYTFRPAGASTSEEGLAIAYAAGVVGNDEVMLHPDPYPSRQAWCWARLAYTRKRLTELNPELPTVLVNHFPLVRKPTLVLRHPEFAQWCGTQLTADWHVRYRATAVVYGHLHIPRTIWCDGVPFEEVSLGYPREWRQPWRAGRVPGQPRQILPAQPEPGAGRGVVKS
jgi:3',5'-cyclic AMP phosphodiesterase CpdA